METALTKELDSALLAAQSHVRSVEKDSKNEFHKYKYASAEDVLREARHVLNEAGLTASRASWKMSSIGDTAFIEMGMRLAHGATGQARVEQIVYPVIPDKGRPLDKAVNSALTTSLAYWLRDLLLIPRGEDEIDQRDDRKFAPTQNPTPRSTATQQPSPSNHPLAKNDAFSDAIKAAFDYGEWHERDRKLVVTKVCQDAKIKTIAGLLPADRQKFVEEIGSGKFDRFKLTGDKAGHAMTDEEKQQIEQQEVANGIAQ